MAMNRRYQLSTELGTSSKKQSGGGNWRKSGKYDSRLKSGSESALFTS